MNGKKFCTACNVKIESNNYLKDRTVCKTCYNLKRRKNNNTSVIKNQQPKIVKVNNNNNRTLTLGFSNCGKPYLMNHILHQKQELIFCIAKSINQYPNIKAQTLDEFLPLESYENSTVVFDDMLLSKQESNIDLFFTRARHNNIAIYYISQSYFHLPKKLLFVIILIKIFYLNKLDGISYYYFMT